MTANRVNHHPIITIDHDSVEITLYTKDINDITESDVGLSKLIDEIFDDIIYIREL